MWAETRRGATLASEGLFEFTNLLSGVKAPTQTDGETKRHLPLHSRTVSVKVKPQPQQTWRRKPRQQHLSIRCIATPMQGNM